MRRRFTTLDVFTSTPFTGNPLAVLHEAQGLDDAAMQTVAREFNLPETVFVFLPREPAHAAQLRIFTPAVELPFAGHPTVGAAVILGLMEDENAREMVLEEKIGPVRCRFRRERDNLGHASFELPKLPEFAGEASPHEVLAAALGLDPGDIRCDPFPAGKWTAGNVFTMVPVSDLATIARARPNLVHWDAAFGTSGPRGAFLFCKETAEKRRAFHARMFAPYMGIPEDPATGSAIAAFAGLLATYGNYSDGEHVLTVEQGFEMGRPSLIELTIHMQGGRLGSAAIAGQAVVIAEGTIEA